MQHNDSQHENTFAILVTEKSKRPFYVEREEGVKCLGNAEDSVELLIKIV